MDVQTAALLANDALEKDSFELEEYSAVKDEVQPFSWAEYAGCFVLGIGMMWTWNAVVAAAPYFNIRLYSNEWILHHVESSMFATFASCLLGSITVFVMRRKNASYVGRIYLSLSLYATISVCLAISTVLWIDTKPPTYFGFLIVAAGFVGLGNGLSQNGGYSFVAGFGQNGYTQAVLLGCATSGIVPPAVQILMVVYSEDNTNLAVNGSTISRTWPCAMFLICAVVAAMVMCTVAWLSRRQKRMRVGSFNTTNEKKSSGCLHNIADPLDHTTFFKKSYHEALAICLCFVVTTCSPVFSSKVESVHPKDHADWRNQQLIFVPLAYLIWQFSDFVGSFIPLVPIPAITNPRVLLSLAIARFGFLIMYNLCNIDGRGAILGGDLFYLFFVQALSGLTNGWLSIACMSGSSSWDSKSLREQAGGFLSFYLIAGLAIGSFLSFIVA